MKTTAILIALMCLFISSIMGDIKDFIIENETDLKRLGFTRESEDHYEDDLENTGWTYNECGNGYNFYGDYMTNEGAGIEYDMSQIDPVILREILWQMKNDPRFEHLWEQLGEEYFMFGQQTRQPDEDHSNFYIDFDDNYGTEEIE